MRIALVFRVLVTLVALVPLPGLLSAVYVDAEGEWRERPSQTREFAFTKRHLASSFDGYGPSDVIAPPFAIIALSHFAAGLMNVWTAEKEQQAEVTALLDEVARRATHPNVIPRSLGDRQPFDATSLDDQNLYLSHLGVILGVRRIVACAGDRSCPNAEASDAMHERIVHHLRARSLGSPLAHAPSYPDSEMWPADQAVTLLALRLYDEAHHTELLEAPLELWLETMKKHTDPETGLFHSSVSPLVYATTPRGCALSWTSLYLAQVEPDVAREQYQRYREHMSADVLGFGGFREWPVDRDKGGMDADSGPIFFGVGMAATGLGLGPARLFGDADRYTTIRRSALTFGVPSVFASHGYDLAPILGEAILFHGRTARPWFGPPSPPVKAPRANAFSFPSLVLLLGYVALVVVWVRPLLRPVAHRRAASKLT
ncbi:MAG: hypothetical protein JST00_31475 [Deltaproteobacteria bacterium]|nr:hypothetical protein [Deltaproteobacteria bacterium]